MRFQMAIAKLLAFSAFSASFQCAPRRPSASTVAAPPPISVSPPVQARDDSTVLGGADPLARALDGVSLTPREREDWGGYVTEYLAPCSDVAVSVAQCLTEKRSCARCLPAARALAVWVREGRARSQVRLAFMNRFDRSAARSVPEDGSPTFGAPSAPVAITVFSDFECPACADAYPIFEKAALAHPGQVRVIYKFVSLKQHLHAEAAARAAIAAGAQGAFWEMHHTLFQHQSALEPRDFEAYARALGLDVQRFRVEMNAAQTTARLDKDARLATELSVQKTPTVYVNGREFDFGAGDVGEFEQRIADELPAAPPPAVQSR